MPRIGAVDMPNERSSHVAPTPRGGGIAVLIGLGTSFFIFGGAGDRVLVCALVAAVAVAAVGLADDVKHLSILPRLIVHLTVAIVTIWIGDLVLRRIELPFVTVGLDGLALPFTVFFVVGWINAYNFMDGVNGIAAVQAIIGGTALAALLWRSGDSAGAMTAMALAGACAGFLPWNFPVGRIFMGDVGSGPIGFLFSILILRASPKVGVVAAALPLFPFLFDSSVTMVWRAARGEKFFTPHRKHFYQQLAQLSGSHVVSTVVWGSLAVISSAAALAYPNINDVGAAWVLTSVLVIHTCAAIAIGWRFRRLRPGADGLT